MGIMLKPIEIPCQTDAIDEDVYRWSDLVPPQSALTFGAVWDPEEDLVVFSQPNISEDNDRELSAHYLNVPPHDLSELRSLTISSLASSSHSSRFDLFEEQHEDLFPSGLREQRSLRGMTQTSSTLGGLDVYLKGAALAKTHRHQPNYSVLNFSNEFSLDPPSGETNIYLTYLARGHLSQALGLPFSVPQVQRISDAWSSIESPTAEELAMENARNLSPASSNSSAPRPRRLKKRRPSEASNTTTPERSPDSPGIRNSPAPRLAEHLVSAKPSSGVNSLMDVWSCRKLRKNGPEEWVLIEH